MLKVLSCRLSSKVRWTLESKTCSRTGKLALPKVEIGDRKVCGEADGVLRYIQRQEDFEFSLQQIRKGYRIFRTCQFPCHPFLSTIRSSQEPKMTVHQMLIKQTEKSVYRGRRNARKEASVRCKLNSLRPSWPV